MIRSRANRESNDMIIGQHNAVEIEEIIPALALLEAAQLPSTEYLQTESPLY
jgi:hypothetical protein